MDSQFYKLDSNVRRGRGRPPRSAYVQQSHIREELPYVDFHPDLVTSTPLSILEADNLQVAEQENSIRPHEPTSLTKATFRTCELPVRESVTLQPYLKDAGFVDNHAWPVENAYAREAGDDLEWAHTVVEYDMDEQDGLFLDELNKMREKDAAPPISPELFELLMTRIEREWNLLELRIPKPKIEIDTAEESRCNICDNGECENSNAIVFCDGCDLAVHQDCYGVPYIPEGQWLCRRCHIAPKTRLSCIFCPNENGALKQTSNNRWAHLVCALWIPEVTIGNHVYMEPIDSAEKIPKLRWKLICYICRQKMGACIQCSNKHCVTAFHATCARRAHLYVKTRTSIHDPNGRKAFCDKHVSQEWQIEHDTGAALLDARAYYTLNMENRIWPDSQAVATSYPTDTPELIVPKLKLSLKPTAKAVITSRLPSGAPIVPKKLLEKALALAGEHVDEAEEAVQMICKYWTLKRELRHGGALLKLKPREIWGTGHKITRREAAKKYELANFLKSNLESLGRILETVKEREKLKLKSAIMQKKIVDNMVFKQAADSMDVVFSSDEEAQAPPKTPLKKTAKKTAVKKGVSKISKPKPAGGKSKNSTTKGRPAKAKKLKKDQPQGPRKLRSGIKVETAKASRGRKKQ